MNAARLDKIRPRTRRAGATGRPTGRACHGAGGRARTAVGRAEARQQAGLFVNDLLTGRADPGGLAERAHRYGIRLSATHTVLAARAADLTPAVIRGDARLEPEVNGKTYRRLVRCYERRPEHHQAMLLWATIHLMTRRLTRELAGQPPAPRWGSPAPLPELTSPDRRGKILELFAAQPWRAWHGVELAAILGITNVNSFRVQLSQWSHQGYINKIGPALYAPVCTS